mmetsp:Transcript_60487/g.155888  ORF Transcript_60487/g.155888 Transcript_60487/m.155888 type:complete len:495 (+) Transcript_60487:88-1572(+)
MVAAPPSTFDRIFGGDGPKGQENDPKRAGTLVGSPFAQERAETPPRRSGASIRAASPNKGLGTGLSEKAVEACLRSPLGARRRRLTPPGSTDVLSSVLANRGSPPTRNISPSRRSLSPRRGQDDSEPHILPGAPCVQRCLEACWRSGEDTRSVIRTFPDSQHYRTSCALRCGSPGQRQEKDDEHCGMVRQDGLPMGGTCRSPLAETAAVHAASDGIRFCFSPPEIGAHGADADAATAPEPPQLMQAVGVKGASFTPLARVPGRRHSPSPRRERVVQAILPSDPPAESRASPLEPPVGGDAAGMASPRPNHELMPSGTDFRSPSPRAGGKRCFYPVAHTTSAQGGEWLSRGLDKGLNAEPTINLENFMGYHRRHSPPRDANAFSPRAGSPPQSPPQLPSGLQRAGTTPSWAAMAAMVGGESPAGLTPASPQGAVQSSWSAQQRVSGLGPSGNSHAWNIGAPCPAHEPDDKRFRRREDIQKAPPNRRAKSGGRWRF